MKGKSVKNPQLNVFNTQLVNVINIKRELVLLAQKIDLDKVEKDISVYFLALEDQQSQGQGFDFPDLH